MMKIFSATTLMVCTVLLLQTTAAYADLVLKDGPDGVKIVKVKNAVAYVPPSNPKPATANHTAVTPGNTFLAH